MDRGHNPLNYGQEGSPMNNFLCKFAAASFESRVGFPPRMASAHNHGMPLQAYLRWRESNSSLELYSKISGCSWRGLLMHQMLWYCRRGGQSLVLPHARLSLFINCSFYIARYSEWTTKGEGEGEWWPIVLRTYWLGRTRPSPKAPWTTVRPI
jgi:hypothetical protein